MLVIHVELLLDLDSLLANPNLAPLVLLHRPLELRLGLEQMDRTRVVFHRVLLNLLVIPQNGFGLLLVRLSAVNQGVAVPLSMELVAREVMDALEVVLQQLARSHRPRANLILLRVDRPNLNDVLRWAQILP